VEFVDERVQDRSVLIS